MNEHPRATDDELTQRIARALRSREATAPDAFVVATRIEAQLGAQGAAPSTVRVLSRRGGRVVVAGVVTSALAVAGAGAAAATAVTHPYSDVARVVENVAQSVGVEWSAMPDGYTREQYDAFWGAEHTDEDVLRLSALWHSDATATKARAGQMILDGLPVPAAPGSGTAPSPMPVVPPVYASQAQSDAFWDAGYSMEDATLLTDLWGVELGEMKATAGQMILDGEALPIAPGDGGAPEDPLAAPLDAFWAAGYTWADAEDLGKLWHMDALESKVEAGQMILDGEVLPFRPGLG